MWHAVQFTVLDGLGHAIKELIGVQLNSTQLIESINSMAELSYKSDWTRIVSNTTTLWNVGVMEGSHRQLEPNKE
jgi:hypothetical protein